MAKQYPCQAILAEYLRHGSVDSISASFLDPPRNPVPRDRAGRIAYWTEAARDHVASWRLWSAADAYSRLYRSLLQAGRSEEAGSALASAVCLACNARLLSMCESADREIRSGADLGSDDPIRSQRVSWICDLSNASKLSDLVASIPADAEARRRMAEAVPREVLAVCLIADAEECLAGASGDLGIKEAVYSRLFRRLRAYVPPGRCTGRPVSLRSSRPSGRPPSARSSGSP